MSDAKPVVGKEYSIPEHLAEKLEKAGALEDTIVALSLQTKKLKKDFWGGVYLLHPELDRPQIELHYRESKRLSVTVARQENINE